MDKLLVLRQRLSALKPAVEAAANLEWEDSGIEDDLDGALIRYELIRARVEADHYLTAAETTLLDRTYLSVKELAAQSRELNRAVVGALDGLERLCGPVRQGEIPEAVAA
jgi:hypothetical protein